MRILDGRECDVEAAGCRRAIIDSETGALQNIVYCDAKRISRITSVFASCKVCAGRMLHSLAISVTRNSDNAIWQFWAFFVVITVIVVLAVLNQPQEQPHQEKIRWQSTPFNTTRSLFISMKPSDQAVSEQIDILRNVVGFEGAEVLPAVNGKSVDRDTLPLYTRYLMEQGRHDHHQVSTAGMVGCYLSHIRAMEMMKPGDIFAIFEEDARFTEAGASQLKQLHDFVGSIGLDYSAIMIGINRVPSPSGDTYTMPVADGLDLVGCTKDCTMWGTRGYILTYDGAQKILKHAYPIQTQIDALISLVARYDESFKLFWTAQDIALGPPLLAIVKDINYSQVQDHCLKCHLPTSNTFYIVFFILLGVVLAACYWYLVSRGCCRRRCPFPLEVSLPAKDPPALILSPRNEGQPPSTTMPKLDEVHDQVQVQVQSSAVPQVLPAAANLQMCHRRTGSRDGEATFLSTLSSEHLQALHFACHRRTGSRDVNIEVVSATPESAGAKPADTQLPST